MYKGVLKGGDVVAIKRLGPARSQGEREFRSEVDIISSVRHRNVVRLRGCCSEGAKRLLVYDYLPKGSLDSHIFGEQPQRVLGAAEGLDVGPLEECFVMTWLNVGYETSTWKYRCAVRGSYSEGQAKQRGALS